MNYYYLVASLPLLTLSRPAPLPLPAFLRLCEEQLTARDLEALWALVEREGDGAGEPFLAAWQERERRLRNAIARARGSRAGRDAGPYLRPTQGFDLATERAVAEAFARPTPLDRELELDRFRWRVLDELAGFNMFGLPAVLAYALKLRMVERWSALDAGRGLQAAEAFAEQQGKSEQQAEVRSA